MKDLYEIMKMVSKSDSINPWRDIVDCEYNKLNRKIRTEIAKELNKPPTLRDKEIEEIIVQERIKWESDKTEFESNPLHWTNNKRRRNGLQTLRGRANKNRATKFHSFKPTPRVFFVIEDIIEETLSQKISENFEQFVDIKDLALGDRSIYRI